MSNLQDDNTHEELCIQSTTTINKTNVLSDFSNTKQSSQRLCKYNFKQKTAVPDNQEQQTSVVAAVSANLKPSSDTFQKNLSNYQTRRPAQNSFDVTTEAHNYNYLNELSQNQLNNTTDTLSSRFTQNIPQCSQGPITEYSGSQSSQNMPSLIQCKLSPENYKPSFTPSPRKIRVVLRDLVMFLLIVNSSIWLLTSLGGIAFKVYHYQDFYFGSTVWIITTSITFPLSSFLKLHSSACLFKIWLYA